MQQGNVSLVIYVPSRITIGGVQFLGVKEVPLSHGRGVRGEAAMTNKKRGCLESSLPLLCYRLTKCLTSRCLP